MIASWISRESIADDSKNENPWQQRCQLELQHGNFSALRSKTTQIQTSFANLDNSRLHSCVIDCDFGTQIPWKKDEISDWVFDIEEHQKDTVKKKVHFLFLYIDFFRSARWFELQQDPPLATRRRQQEFVAFFVLPVQNVRYPQVEPVSEMCTNKCSPPRLMRTSTCLNTASILVRHRLLGKEHTSLHRMPIGFVGILSCKLRN